MPITEDERHLVYEILGVPNATSVLNVNGDYGTGRKFQSHAILTAQNEINAILGGLAAAPLARLQELLVEWKKVSIDSVAVKPNAANEGVDVNPGRTRGLIRSRVRAIVPVFVEDRQAGTALPLG